MVGVGVFAGARAGAGVLTWQIRMQMHHHAPLLLDTPLVYHPIFHRIKDVVPVGVYGYRSAGSPPILPVQVHSQLEGGSGYFGQGAHAGAVGGAGMGGEAEAGEYGGDG